MKIKFAILFLLSLLVGYGGYTVGLTLKQASVLSVFVMSILGTLFFWDFRLSFVFVGAGIFLIIKAVVLEEFILFASLDVILFLIAMMIIVGMMKEAGFFFWLITVLLRINNLDGRKLFLILMLASALFSAMMGEVASIIVMVTVILNICTFLEISPLPLVVSSVMATNIGSAATVLGNPVGVLIAARSSLSFEDFLTHAFPVSVLVLLVSVWILAYVYRRYIGTITELLKEYQEDKGFLYLISIPPDRKTKISMGIFAVTIFLIGLHKRLELMLGLQENTLLIMLPIISAGVVMFYRHDKARYYVEHEVEWNSLLFFMFLFAQAGVIRATGIADFFAQKIVATVGNHPRILSGIVLFTSGILSSGLDNVVAVASYIPVVKSLDMLHINLKPLWWSLLFGACYGGNITMLGSTANIVALGLLEKEENIKVNFYHWLKLGLLIGMVSMFIAFMVILLMSGYYEI